MYKEIIISHTAEAHFEVSQISKMEPFAEMFSGFESLATFAESFILDVSQGSKYASVQI